MPKGRAAEPADLCHPLEGIMKPRLAFQLFKQHPRVARCVDIRFSPPESSRSCPLYTYLCPNYLSLKVGQEVIVQTADSSGSVGWVACDPSPHQVDPKAGFEYRWVLATGNTGMARGSRVVSGIEALVWARLL